ncbi:Indoleamine 2,3-dioxygenase [Lichtheimia hyalospora FSU 10163]|nr:Indoleamine 2,3-dioxygenase [Lichtheimia hyalospora FSU 10163]
MPAMHPMKPLEEYDISPTTGFLPPEPPLRRLPDAYFAPWESMMDDFNGLLLAGKLRRSVEKMPMLDYRRLKTTPEYRRAFLVLCMISHGYVWGKHEKTSETLPANLAVPWTGIANHLGLCPVVCNAAVVLWNYRLLDEDGPIDLSNLAALATYSGSLDESWFYLVTTAIESAGAPSITAIVNAINHIHENNQVALLNDLETIRNSLSTMNDVLQRMYEKCDPYVFYWKIRPYLAGWENMAEAGLPFGLIYEGVDSLWDSETDEYADMSHLSEGERLLRQYRRYAGGSAAQSSLIATLDVALGVAHYPTGEKNTKTDTPANDNGIKDRYKGLPTPNPADELHQNNGDQPSTPQIYKKSSAPPFVRTNRNAFLSAMRAYMPRPHREFLEDLETACNIRPYMMQLQENKHTLTDTEKDLIRVYNEILGLLKNFRDIHVRIVTLYIVNQARKGPNIAHGGFAIDTGDVSEPVAKKTKVEHNVLYPQTALETEPHIREGSLSAKVSKIFPELGLAKYVDPKTGVVRGTGGTNVLPFLKQSRDETADAKIDISSSSSSSSSKTHESTTMGDEANTSSNTLGKRARKSWRDWFSVR